jgi:hypothetical protein
MSVIEEALVTRLLADATVAAAVGTRIYPLVAPQGAAMPHIVYQRISGPRVHTHQGSDLAHPRFQFACNAATYAAAKALANAVREELDGTHVTQSGVRIDRIQTQNELDVFNKSQSQAADTYTTLVDVVVGHGE